MGRDRGRRTGWGFLPTVIALILLVGLGRPALLLAQEQPSERLFGLINQARLNEGLAPLGRSTLLSQAAQRHADDLVSLGIATHEGSDGSSYQQRIREARYQAWNDGLMVNELLWVGLGTADDALAWFASNADGQLLADAHYREIGVGYASDGGVHYFVITLGSRPGVIPIFINDGAETTDSPMVALRLTNEEAVSMGEGTWVGKAIEVRLSNTPQFEGLEWQPWEPLLPWLLAGEEPGEYEVYAEFRDGAGRTAVAQDTIRLVAPGEVVPTATPVVQVIMPTAASGAGTPVTGVETPAVSQPEATRPPVAPTAEPGSGAPTPEIDLGTLTPYPTWTPLPEDAPVETEEKATDWPLLAALGLQGLALLLGAAVFLRRR